jgi:hypothetical protein
MTWLLWRGLILCLLVVVAAGLYVYGTKCWTITGQALTSRLEAGRRFSRNPRRATARVSSKACPHLCSGTSAPCSKTDTVDIVPGMTHGIDARMLSLALTKVAGQ